jgi:hypothetical protein
LSESLKARCLNGERIAVRGASLIPEAKKIT